MMKLNFTRDILKNIGYGRQSKALRFLKINSLWIDISLGYKKMVIP